MRPGKKPASAAPSRKRTTYSDTLPVTNICAIVHSPHSTMMRISVRLAPIRASTRLLGTSNAA
jgi:hypothetical protein